MADVYPHARVITAQGSPAPVPRYYKSLLKEYGSDVAFDMSARTMARLYSDLDRRVFEDMPERRAARTTYAKARTGVFKRDVKDS